MRRLKINAASIASGSVSECKSMDRHDLTFDSWGERCAAWLYRPEQADGDAGCVVLGHGWTGTRDQRLDAYAERFAEAGFAALAFDYRNFGDSEGEPRQLLDVRRQLEDWAAALAFARTLDGIDPERIAAWGTSFGGGHVVTTAARDHRLAAAIAQVPFVDGLRNLPRLGPAHALRLTIEGLKDVGRAMRGAPPHMLASVGPPGSTAVMNSPDAEPGFRAIVPPGSKWPNEAPARIALRVGTYRPITKAGAIRCPILFQIAEDDVVTPPEFAEKAAAAAPRSEVLRYPGGHFDVYLGAAFERVTADAVDFLRAHL
jgi:dienelactone hydrolase